MTIELDTAADRIGPNEESKMITRCTTDDCGRAGTRLVTLERHEDGNIRCQRCEGDGSFSELAPCTTSGSDCACNGPRVLVDPCPECGGSGNAPETSLRPEDRRSSG